MRALAYACYGPPIDVMTVRTDLPEPVVGPGDVLVQVVATSLNSWDWDLVTGSTQGRLVGGWTRPRLPILGCDIAGRVVQIGPGVERFAVGDEVLGDDSGAAWGGLGERVAVPQELLAKKSPTMSFEQAAATPQAGVLALQGLQMGSALAPGKRVLLNGASGGVGTFALQLACSFGATVDCVDHGDKLDPLTQLGAAGVFDHRCEDPTIQDGQYDAIVDVVGTRPFTHWRRVLAPGGTYAVVGGSLARIAQTFAVGAIVGRVTGQHLGVLLHRPNAADLDCLTQMFEEGRYRPVIDRVVGLDEAPRALADLGAGRVLGKVVVTL